MEKQELDLQNVPQSLIVLIVLVLMLSVGAAILAGMSSSTSNQGSSFTENPVLFTNGQATLSYDYCTSVTSFGTFETSWPLP